MIVKCLDIVKQRLKFSLILVKAMLFLNNLKKKQQFHVLLLMAPLLAPFVKQRLKFLFILVKAMVF